MMAPIPRGVATKYRTNGLTNGVSGFHDAPPSTLVVQLVNNLSAASKPSRQIEQDDLQRLMQEVSSLENGAEEPTSIDAKLEHHHKLIYVFARAILERLTKEDPFTNIQQLLLQASEALDIFIVTIKETPGVLVYVTKSGSHFQTRGQEPLWIWLFPRVLTLLGRRECDTLMEKLKEFFQVSFEAVARSPKLWNLTSSFFCYLRECVSSM
jgi:serine/threonine-protein kinase ATR